VGHLRAADTVCSPAAARFPGGGLARNHMMERIHGFDADRRDGHRRREKHGVAVRPSQNREESRFWPMVGVAILAEAN
jgi:hypothetical protein